MCSKNIFYLNKCHIYHMMLCIHYCTNICCISMKGISLMFLYKSYKILNTIYMFKLLHLHSMMQDKLTNIESLINNNLCYKKCIKYSNLRYMFYIDYDKVRLFQQKNHKNQEEFKLELYMLLTTNKSQEDIQCKHPLMYRLYSQESSQNRC